MSFESRRYDGRGDLPAMIALLLEVRPSDRLANYPSVADLRELLDRDEVQSNARLWRDAGGRLVAFAIVDPDLCNLLFELAPQAAGSHVEAHMIAWGLECLRRAHPDADHDFTLDTCCADDDLARIALLGRHGFAPQAERTLRMIRRLDEAIPAPVLPSGYRMRHVAGEHAVEEYVALHRAAFGTQFMTVENRLAIMRAPDYESELDLIAVAPDGEWAAFCVCQIHRPENAATGRREGWTDPIGTHPHHRRRGLARALLLTGLRRLKARGMDAALLGTLNTNVAMQQLARSAGFCTRSTVVWFSKPLSAT